jgi:uncharacterized tellurite resistance protein B-like protein
MDENSVTHLLLKTAFCCMACDGEIASEEVALIKSICKKTPALQLVDFETEINQFITDINVNSKGFLSDFFKTIEQNAPDLTEQEEFDLINIAVKVIKADNKIEYSEIKFFKAIRYCFKVNDDRVISHFSKSVEDIDLFLGQDIQTTFEGITQQYFNSFSFDALQMLE